MRRHLRGVKYRFLALIKIKMEFLMPPSLEKNHLSSLSPIHATVAFGSGKCMVGINATLESQDFIFTDDRLQTSANQTIIWPDIETAKRVIAMLQNDIDSVFVVEFGPHAQPIAEHRIVSVISPPEKSH